MSVSTTTVRNRYTGNGATSSYSFTFRIEEESDLLVTVRHPTTYAETTLTLTTDYTVSGEGEDAGGSITLVNSSQAWLTSGALTSGYIIVLRRNFDITNEASFKNQGAYYPERLDAAFDRATRISQQQQDQLTRALKAPETDDTSGLDLSLPCVTERASKFLAFDADGNPIAADGVTETPVSAFMETVLDDTTAAAAQTTLGISAFAQTLLDDASANAAQGTLGVSPNAENVIINGNFNFWQRGTSLGVTTAAKNYQADRWFVYASTTSGSPSFTYSRQTASLAGSQYCARVQRVAANTYANGVALVQGIESVNCYPLQGRTVTLRFYARRGANFSGASNYLSAYLIGGTGTDETPLNTYTGEGTIAGSSSIALTTSWQLVELSGTFSSTYNEARVAFVYNTVGTAGAADYFEIAQVMVYPGPAGLPFRRAGNTVAGELQLCQRYYEKSYQVDTNPGTNATPGNMAIMSYLTTAVVMGPVVFRAMKRIDPTITLYSYAGTSGKVAQMNGTSDIGNTMSIGFQHQGGFNRVNDSGTPFSAATSYWFNWTADAEL
jgi:hypothetical protein